MDSEEFKKQFSEISDSDLAIYCEKELSNVIRKGGATLCVPPDIKDTDMLFMELVNRFKQLTN